MPAVNTASLTRMSVSSAGTMGYANSFATELSSDGRYVLFNSFASNLVSGDANDSPDVFLRDTLTGTTALVSVAPDGSVGNGSSYTSSISADGRYVAFYSYASNLAGSDANGSLDVFVRDVQSGATFRISQAADGSDGNDGSYRPQISGDGRFVVFYSSSSNLVAGDTNDSDDVFVYDMLNGTNRIVSVASDGSQGNAGSYTADISADGRYVVFASTASNLVAGDINDRPDIFLRDTVAGTTTLVSVSTGGGQTSNPSYNAKVSDNGRYVVFENITDSLVDNDTNGQTDVFLRDTVAGTTTLVSANAGGIIGNGYSGGADISADGRYVVFESDATNLVSGDTNGKSDVFLRDMVTGTITRLSLAWNGAEANNISNSAHISADGHSVIFTSFATNLVRGDVNGQGDVFRVSLSATDAADRLIGSDGADSLSGLGGADILIGGLGADTLSGGAGNDTFIVDNLGDKVVEADGGGFDTVQSSVSFSLAGQYIETLTLTGTGTVKATGNSLANTLLGNDAANVLDGGAGADILTGGGGSDSFAFRAALGSGVDRITDFSPAVLGNDDTILLSGTVFGLSKGTLKSTAFKDVGAAGASLDASDRIVYDRTTGYLAYDADGSGSKAAVRFATLDNKAILTAADFTVV